MEDLEIQLEFGDKILDDIGTERQDSKKKKVQNVDLKIQNILDDEGIKSLHDGIKSKLFKSNEQPAHIPE